MILFETLIQSYTSYYVDNGHTLIPRSPLVHPAFKTSFLMSAGVIDMQERLSGKRDGLLRTVLVQPCFRYFDMDSIKSNTHLSLFHMGAALYYDIPTRKSVLEPMIKFFTEELTIDPKKLWFTVFGGGKVKGFLQSPDTESKDVWNYLNMPMNQVVMNNVEKNFWTEGTNTGEEPSGICGPHAEIFYDRGYNKLCNTASCLPGCSCGRFLELGNAVFPQYRLTKRGIESIPTVLAEVAIGLDRVSMVLNATATIFDIPALNQLKTEVHDGPLAKTQDLQALFAIIDHLRSFCCLIAEGAMPSRKGRGHILRKLLRKCVTISQSLSLPPYETIYEVVELLMKHPESALDINLIANTNNVRSVLEREFRLFAN